VRTEATRIPEGIEVDVDGLPIGTNVTAGDLKLPEGVELAMDPETIVMSVVAEAAPEATEEEEEGEAAE